MNATILVADDAPGVRQLLRTILARAGYATFEAVTGPDAVRLAEQVRPDLVLLDIDMAVMNGYEVCAHLRRLASCASLKIAMLTAYTRAEDRQRAVEVGADAFIVKPFRPIALMATISALLTGSDLSDLPGGSGLDLRGQVPGPGFDVHTVASWGHNSLYGASSLADRTSSNGI